MGSKVVSKVEGAPALSNGGVVWQVVQRARGVSYNLAHLTPDELATLDRAGFATHTSDGPATWAWTAAGWLAMGAYNDYLAEARQSALLGKLLTEARDKVITLREQVITLQRVAKG